MSVISRLGFFLSLAARGQTNRRRSPASIVRLVAFFLLTFGDARAQVLWTGDGNQLIGIGDAGNWLERLPNEGEDIAFGTSPLTNVNVPESVVVGDIIFNETEPARPSYNFFGLEQPTLTLSGDILVGSGGDVTLTDSLNLRLSSGNHTVDVANAVTVFVESAVSSVDGTSGITKAGGGTLVLSGLNTFAGPTTIANGYLSISSDDNLGSVPEGTIEDHLTIAGGSLAVTQDVTLHPNRGITVMGASFDVAAGKTLTYLGKITGSEGIDLNPVGGTLELGGQNDYTGVTTIHGGSIRVSSSAGLGAVGEGNHTDVTAGGTLELSDVALDEDAILLNGTLTASGESSVTGAITLGGAPVINGTGTLSISGDVIGSVMLTKTGSGTLQLSGTNTFFTGGLTGDDGTIKLESSSARGSGTWTLESGITLDLDVAAAFSSEDDTEFYDFAHLNANQPGAISGGQQYFYDSSHVHANATNSISGGVQRFYDTSSLFANEFNSVVDVTLKLYANSFIEIAAEDALSNTTNIYFNGSSGGVSGELRLNGFATNVGYISSGVGGDGGRIRNDSSTATTLSVSFDADEENPEDPGKTFFGIISDGTVDGQPAASLSLVKDGSGILTLSGLNSYTGTTTINGGTLRLGIDNAISSTDLILGDYGVFSLDGHTATVGSISGDFFSTINLGAGSLTTVIDSESEVSFAGQIMGEWNSTLIKEGTGSLMLAGENYYGSTSVVQGTLIIGAENALRTGTGEEETSSLGHDIAVAEGATLSVESHQTIRALSGAGTVSIGENVKFTSNLPSGDPVAFDGAFTGTGTLAKEGPGTMILTGGSPNFAGGIELSNGGALEISDPEALGDTDHATVVGNGASLVFSGGLDVGGEQITLVNGTLAASGLASLAGDIVLAGGGTVEVADDSVFTLTGDIINGEVDPETEFGNSLAKTGLGTLVLSGTGTNYTGTTIIQDGAIEIAAENALPTTTFVDLHDASKLFVNRDQTIMGLISTAEDASEIILAAGKTLTISGGDDFGGGFFGGSISGDDGRLVLEGTASEEGFGTYLALFGENTYTGGTTITNAVLQIGDGDEAGSIMGNIVNDGALIFSRSNDVTYGGDGGVISGSGDFAWMGGSEAVLTLSSANLYTGHTYIGSGILRVGTPNALPISTEVFFEPESSNQLDVVENQTVAGFWGYDSTSTISIGSDRTLTLAPQVAEVQETSFFAGTITGAGGLKFNGSDDHALVLTGDNSYAGGTVVNGGLLVAGHQNAFGIGANSAVTLNSGGVATANGTTVGNTLNLNAGYIGGNGVFTATTTVGANVIIAPEDVAIVGDELFGEFGSVATLGFQNLSLAGGGTFEWNIINAQGSIVNTEVPAEGWEWDRLEISGILSLSTLTASNQFTLKIVSLSSPGNMGAIDWFDNSQAYSWTIISAQGNISGFNAAKFDIVETGFANSLGGGAFSLSKSGNNIMLNFTPVPEPSTWALMIAGGGVLAVAAHRRRRR